MEESIPASSRIVLSHLAMELDVTALCSFIKEMNNLLSFSLNCLVLSKYVSRVFTGHRVVLARNAGK